MNDLINRQDAIDAPEKLIKDCNPDHFVGHQKFIEFMDNAEIGSFGNWQFANGFNLGLTAAEVEIEKLLSVQPEVLACGSGELNAQSEQRWIPVSERLPEERQEILATTTDNAWGDVVIIRTYYKEMHKSVIAWMPLPEPWKGEKNEL